MRDSTYVLDGLLYHESELRIAEHYTDTAGFTDHVFALMHLLGFRFAPRIRDLTDKKLYVHGDAKRISRRSKRLIGGDSQLAGDSHAVGGNPAAGHVDQAGHGDRLADAAQAGEPTRARTGWRVALRELGRIERTLFVLDWLQSLELRRRVHVGLNKGEARNALARAVFFNRLGELRDRSYEQQHYRASGLNLVVAAIVLWNTVYLEHAVQAATRTRAADRRDAAAPPGAPGLGAH